MKLLQDEQREIESKLKFIDSLINQQQTAATNVKYIGGGILKRQTTEDFVVNLDQYTRAMEELRITMEKLVSPQKQRSKMREREEVEAQYYRELKDKKKEKNAR